MAVIGRHVDVGMVPYSTGAQMLREGKLRPLLTTASTRLAALPDTPTLSEKGLPTKGFNFVLVFMLQRKARRIDQLALATNAYALQAAILFDKFHVMRHLGEALDQVRKREYARLQGRGRRYIKGQKYTLLSRKENLTLEGKKALQTLLAANKRLNTAYVLKESFGQLWSYEREGWARRFFENWRSSLKWQRLKPYEKFAQMIDRHWDGIAAYCRPENKVSLGFVEGLNNKIRVIQRRAYGLRDEDYLRLKILTCMLPAL